jgi:hypothetical protein
MALAAGLMALSMPGLSGCIVIPEEAREAERAELFEVEIPEDFTFATAKGVTVRVEGEASRVKATLAEVRLPSGELIHKGPLSSPVELAVPVSVASLSVTLRSQAGEKTLEVPVQGAEARVRVE